MKAILISQNDLALQGDAADMDEQGRHDDLAHPDSLDEADGFWDTLRIVEGGAASIHIGPPPTLRSP
jgi:hypothetical protein